MRSLLAQLVIALLLSLIVVFGVQWSVVQIAVNDILKEYIAEELMQDANELFSALVFMPGGNARIAVTHFDPPFLTPYSGRYYQVVIDNKITLRSPSLVDQSLAVTLADPQQHRVAYVAGPKAQALLVTTNGYVLQGRAITIAVAGDLNPIQTQFRRLMVRYTQASALVFFLLVMLQIVIVRWALAPLRRVWTDVGRLERGEIQALDERVPSEVLPLVREVNRLVVLLTRRLQRSRESLGNLAHALKAPLTVLTHIASDDHLQRDSVLGRQMGEQLQILRSRIDTELRRARVAGCRASTPPLNVAPEIESLVATLLKLYRDRNLAIDFRMATETRFSGDREDLLELCGNLLDNACKWARSRIVISVCGKDRLVLVVEDDGPGCSPEELSQIARRGVRLDEAIEGHGLGLAIASGIASAYGGEICLGRSQSLGGFEAKAILPAG